jgi:hypothetical protein
MRHDEIGRVDDVVAVKNQIQIERARRAGERALATELLLDAEQRPQEFGRGQ